MEDYQTNRVEKSITVNTEPVWKDPIYTEKIQHSHRHFLGEGSVLHTRPHPEHPEHPSSEGKYGPAYFLEISQDATDRKDDNWD